MSAQKALYRSGIYHEPAQYVSSSFGNSEQLLQDLRSELLVEKEKRLRAENRIEELAKQLKSLQERTHVELLREGERRRDAEKKAHDLELKLRAAETGEVRKTAADETLFKSQEQLVLRRGNSSLLPVERTPGGRNANGIDQVENNRQRIGNKVLRRIASLNHHTSFNNSSSSNYNSHRSDDSNDDDDDDNDDEWQLIVRHNTRILQNPGRGKLSKKSFPEKRSFQKKNSSASTERRNVICFTNHDESQGSRLVDEHSIWRDGRGGSVRERTKSLGHQVSSQQSGHGGLIQVNEQASRIEGTGNTRGAELLSRTEADDNGIAWGADHKSAKGRTSNWPASERSDDELRRRATLIDGYRVNETKKLRAKTIPETEEQEVPKDSVTITISHKDATDVTHVSDSSSLIKTVIYADPAFISRQERKIFWEQQAATGQGTEPRVSSPAGDRVSEESDSTSKALPRYMRLKPKCETTPSYSEA